MKNEVKFYGEKKWLGFLHFYSAQNWVGGQPKFLVPDEDELIVVVPPVLLRVHAGLDVVAWNPKEGL